jgi:signal transduction histidine kinase/ligand-binding sensor domain-containing protein
MNLYAVFGVKCNQMMNLGIFLNHLRQFVVKGNDYKSIKHFISSCLLTALICFSGTLGIEAQPKYIRFEHLTINDGLSSNRIRCIYRDSKDYLWMGTDIGLDKYDSYQVKNYRHGDGQFGEISSDVLICIYEDSKKNLWFGTNDGLNLYDREKDNFRVFKNEPADDNSISSNCITGMVEDKEKNLWTISDGNCLNKFVPGTQTFIRYPFEKGKNYLNPRPSKMIGVDSKGYIWIVSLTRGIRRFDPRSEQFTLFDDPSIDFGNNYYKSIFIDKQDKIWISTDGNGFFSFDPVSKKFEHFNSLADGKGTNQNMVLDILPEDDRYLLLAVDQGGINRFDKVTNTFEYIVYDEENNNGLNNNGIWCLYKDREGIIWIGTSGGGINYYIPKKERFDLFVHNGNNPRSLSYNFTGCFYEDHTGDIWIGTDGGGVNVYDPVTGNFKIFKHDPLNPNSISGNVIRGIAEDKDHNIWIGTWDAGLNKYDRKTGRFIHFMPERNDSSTISGKNIYNLFIDHNNILWLSIYNTGIDLFDLKKGVFRRFRTGANQYKSISGDNSWFFFEDHDNKMWICTQNGLDLYDSLTSTFRVYYFPDNDIGAFYKDRTGNLWVGTNTKGMFRCDELGNIINTYDKTNGLPNNRIHAITEDNQGNLWISSNKGISRFERSAGKFRNYSKEDGLQGDQFYQQSFLKTRKGEIYFGGYNGFNSFNPDSMQDNRFIPPVYITDFRIFNKPVIYAVPGAQFPKHISEEKEIRLNWKQSVFSFSFAAINYNHPNKNQYKYIMEGFETEWNNTDASRRYVTYTNLDPGTYYFKVKATNNDGIWNENETSLRIIILPPWWATLWFRLIAFSVAIFILAFFYYSRMNRLKNQKVLLEELVAIKTSELTQKQEMILLQDENLKINNKKLTILNATKDKFFSIIAHDLKNPFNSILGFSELLIEEFKELTEEKKLEFIGAIHDSSRRIYVLLENLLEWASTQTGNIRFHPEVFDLCEVFETNYALIRSKFEEKGILFSKDLSDNTQVFADYNMISTVIRNLLGNAVKFTEKGEIKAAIKPINNHLEVSISDSGIGIPAKILAGIFEIDHKTSTAGTRGEKGSGLGLLICKEFVLKNGGEIFVTSEEGKGTTFTFTVPRSA